MTDIGERGHRETTPKSKQIVCTACRQSKVRCIGSDTESCARCTRLGLDCFRDANFKRISKSRKIAELEKQVKQLSSVVNTGIAPAYAPGYPVSFSAVDAPSTLPDDIARPPPLQGSGSQPFNAGFPTNVQSFSDPPGSVQSPIAIDASSLVQGRRPLATMTQALETVQLSPSQIDDLFEIFFNHYHPFLPFLDTTKSPDEYQRSCPSLFWAIVSVASRRYRDDITLLTVLSEYVPKIIWADISKPPYTVPTVQAVIVLCLWPFPTTSTWAEPAVTLSSVAISIAMQLGLHRPMNAQDFLRTKTVVNEAELRIRISTWAAANIVSQSLGAVVGQLPTAPFDWTIDQACELGTLYTLPEALRFKVIIQKYCDRVTKLMCGVSNESMSFQSPGDTVTFLTSWENDMATLENDLNLLENENREHFSMIDQLYCSAARVYLHSFYFFDSSNSEQRKRSILKAYNTACMFISQLLQADAESSIFSHLMYYFIRILLTAGCIVLKVLTSSYVEDVEDYEAGKKLFNQTIFAMSRGSVFNNDICGKAIKLLAQMWHSGGGLRRQSPPELIIKSRLGASLTYDFIWTWRQEFGGVPRAYPSPSMSGSQQRDSPVAGFPGFFQDASMVDLAFLDNPDWNLGVEGNLIV